MFGTFCNITKFIWKCRGPFYMERLNKIEKEILLSQKVQATRFFARWRYCGHFPAPPIPRCLRE